MHKKALFLGCSYTYGYELKNPEQDAYPFLLGKLLNWNVVNKAETGGSNDRTVRIVFEEFENNYDLIFIAWTLFTRYEWYDNNVNKFKNISPTNDRNIPWSKLYYKYNYNDENAYNKWLIQIISIQSFFKQIKQPYFFVNTFNMFGTTHKLQNLIDFNNYIDPYSSLYSWAKDCTLGKENHPLEDGHIKIANKIFDFIQRKTIDQK